MAKGAFNSQELERRLSRFLNSLSEEKAESANGRAIRQMFSEWKERRNQDRFWAGEKEAYERVKMYLTRQRAQMVAGLIKKTKVIGRLEKALATDLEIIQEAKIKHEAVLKG
jgi:hypothetical protein